MNISLDLLDAVLADLVRTAPHRQQFTAAAFAEYLSELWGIEVSRDAVSAALQRYRVREQRSVDAACEGYSRNAVWRILGVQDDPSTSRVRRTNRHLYAVVYDALKREALDLRVEVLIPLWRNGVPRVELKPYVDDFEHAARARLRDVAPDELSLGEIDAAAAELADDLRAWVAAED
jgi:hypothetical protein